MNGKQIADIIVRAIKAGDTAETTAAAAITSQAGGDELLDTPILKLAEQLTLRDVIRIAEDSRDTDAKTD